MEVTDALAETTGIVDGLVAGLTPEHREMKTPCKKWTVHDLVNHMANTSKAVAAMASGDMSLMPGDGVDHLPEGPVNGWNDGKMAITGAAGGDLDTVRQTPFGEVPGSMVLSVGVADLLTHGWDLAQATDQHIHASDELVATARSTWAMVVPPEARDGDRFDAEQPCPEGASALDQLAAFTGRSVS